METLMIGLIGLDGNLRNTKSICILSPLPNTEGETMMA